MKATHSPRRALRSALAATCFLAAGACYNPPSAGSSEPKETDAVPPNVLAGLKAVAEGRPFKDDLHPGTIKTGAPLSALQRGFDVRHYALSVRVMPETRTIEGGVDVSFVAVDAISEIELNLDPRLEIRGATLGGVTLDVARNANSVVIALPARLEPGERAVVSVSYGGKPHVGLAPPWHGGFVWSEADGTPWFATAVQTQGCDVWWPCKDHYGDKPDEGVEVAVTAPRGVKVASVGTLAGVEEGEDGFNTWRWTSRHPYTGYAIAINGGPYELVEATHTGVNGAAYPVQFWALPKNADKARALIESDAIPDLKFFERLLGPYPWGDEKAGFVETPHLGMEHQTINGYGEQYKRGTHGFDQLLHHELAHEWFGNLMTHAAPEDSWLHEGYGSYMQAAYAEELAGEMGYMDRMFGAYVGNENCLPIANAAVGDVGEAFDNRDIYTKGAWMLHTLRRHIGETAFWNGTRRLLYDTANPWALSYPIEPRYRSTTDFIRIMSEEADEDISWLVEPYLYEADLPALKTSHSDGVLHLEWSTPGERVFPMPVEVSVDGAVSVVEMREGVGSIAVADGARIVIDPRSAILRALPIIGDCSEQTDAQIAHNIERWTRMAKEYGWRRD